MKQRLFNPPAQRCLVFNLHRVHTLLITITLTAAVFTARRSIPTIHRITCLTCSSDCVAEVVAERTVNCFTHILLHGWSILCSHPSGYCCPRLPPQ
jgi:hypothetical protein